MNYVPKQVGLDSQLLGYFWMSSFKKHLKLAKLMLKY
jgi:hypothetical protein